MKAAAAFVLAIATALLLSGFPTKAWASKPGQIVAMRRLTEAQYRNSIGDIFGPDIKISGRFEPIIRPAHQLLSTGAGDAAISPAGLEQFDAIARSIASQVFDDSHRSAYVGCVPRDATNADDTCAKIALLALGRYLFRRPLFADERSYYVEMARQAAAQTGSFYKGLELALAAMLVAPDFMYIVETAERDPRQPGALRLDNFTRASRLSFLLWNTTPDDELLSAAEKGQLTNVNQLKAIAAKMASSPRLEGGVRAFFTDMLVYEKFDDLSKDPIIYPKFNVNVDRDLPEQMMRFIVDDLVTRDNDYRDLFTSRRTFVTRSLGPIFDVPVHVSNGWEAIEFASDSKRAGLQSQPGFVALYAHEGRSSPTLRGRAIRELLLCSQFQIRRAT